MSTTHAVTRCLRCGYDLRGLPGAHDCPECGEPVVASLLRADRNRLGRDDWTWTTIVALRATLLTHAAMLVLAMTLAFPDWLTLPVSLAGANSGRLVAIAVLASGWASFVAWIAMLWWTRRDAGPTSNVLRFALVLVPLADGVVRTFAIDDWNSTVPTAWMLRLVASVTPLASATVACAWLRRLMAPLPHQPRAMRLVRIAFWALVVLSGVAVVADWFGIAPIAATGPLTPGEGLALLAQAAFLSAFVQRTQVVGRAIGARTDVTIIPHGWVDARVDDRLEGV